MTTQDNRNPNHRSNHDSSRARKGSYNNGESRRSTPFHGKERAVPDRSASQQRRSSQASGRYASSDNWRSQQSQARNVRGYQQGQMRDIQGYRQGQPTQQGYQQGQPVSRGNYQGVPSRYSSYANNVPPRGRQGMRNPGVMGAAAGSVQDGMPQAGASYLPASPNSGEYASSPNGGKNKKNKKWNIVFYVSLGVAAVALIALAVIVGMYLIGRSNNGKIAETAKVSDLEKVALSDMTVDWGALRAINPEVVAWIYMPGTTINYPVVQTTDNEKYLYTNFDGTTQHIVTFGTIFVDYMNSARFTDRNNFIYGHNMNDGSMFAPIAELVDSKAFNEHRTVYLLTPDGNYRLTSFACVHVGATDPIVQTKFASNDDYTAYIQNKIDTSVVTPNDAIPKASEIKKSFAFSTCDDTITSNGRIILFTYVAESTSDYAGGLDSANSLGNGATKETQSAVESAAQATKMGE